VQRLLQQSLYTHYTHSHGSTTTTTVVLSRLPRCSASCSSRSAAAFSATPAARATPVAAPAAASCSRATATASSSEITSLCRDVPLQLSSGHSAPRTAICWMGIRRKGIRVGGERPFRHVRPIKLSRF
jgi:hypothetical protein